MPEPAAAPAPKSAPGPGFLTPEAQELIAGQYGDRPHLRPVLDAVLAVLPALGPVTVQARKTLVSLATPRRAFALVQATTRSRVDLGLRLEHEAPAGRLLSARDIGAATVRIPLASPGDVDDEVLGWLRRAYQENAGPAPAPRPARRPAPAVGDLIVVIEASHLPGRSGLAGAVEEHHNVHIALSTAGDRPTLDVPGKPWRAIEPVPGDAPLARWEAPVTVRRDADGLDFGGPYVRGARGDRHLYLAWGDLADGTLRLFRGSKLKLAGADPRIVEEAMRPGYRLVVRIQLTVTPGRPALTWSAEPMG